MGLGADMGEDEGKGGGEGGRMVEWIVLKDVCVEGEDKGEEKLLFTAMKRLQMKRQAQRRG